MTAQLPLALQASKAATTAGTDLNSHSPFQPPVLVTSTCPALLRYANHPTIGLL